MGKKAVLIGINYPGTEAELKGCINDVRRMQACLLDRFGFQKQDIKMLIDTDTSYTQPTGKNILDALENLVSSAKPGDVLFVHYSGHGTRLPPETGEADDTGYDECIVPCDMNLIEDETFKELVCRVPDGCHITIVSDSCHSGGLISGAKEQIGDSAKLLHQGHNTSSAFSLSGYLKKAVKAVASCGSPRQARQYEPENRIIDEEHNPENRSYHKNKSLPLEILINILKQQTGKDDIDVGKIRPTLFDMFGGDSSPKIKKFMKVMLSKLDEVASVGGHPLEFLKHKLEENDDNYVKPALEAQVATTEEVYAGATKRVIPKNGILLSGCQTDETSADATPSDNAKESYGAFSDAIQTILKESDNPISNRKLVMKARKLLIQQGFNQHPGLYCSDDFVEAPFICS